MPLPPRRREYKDPVTYGWRIKFRRLFLLLGVVLFTCLTVHTAVSSQHFSSKAEIQTLLDLSGTNLTWPDGGSALDDVFGLYNGMERAKSYVMMASTALFWAGIGFDLAGHFWAAGSQRRRSGHNHQTKIYGCHTVILFVCLFVEWGRTGAFYGHAHHGRSVAEPLCLHSCNYYLTLAALPAGYHFNPSRAHPGTGHSNFQGSVDFFPFLLAAELPLS